LTFLGVAAFGFTAFFGLAASFFLGLTTSPILNDPEAPVPFDVYIYFQSISSITIIWILIGIKL
jgi:hypothetical protein